MRLNVNNYQRILSEKGLNNGQVCKSTGLSEKTLNWILENKCLEVSTGELIADTLGCTVKDIYLPDYTDCAENVIEWTKDSERATLTLSQRRTISKVKKLADKYPAICQIVAENKDGSICAHVPVAWIKISPPAVRSEKQREQSRLNMLKRHSLAHEKG